MNYYKEVDRKIHNLIRERYIGTELVERINEIIAEKEKNPQKKVEREDEGKKVEIDR